jgi:hypothetical protein
MFLIGGTLAVVSLFAGTKWVQILGVRRAIAARDAERKHQ